MKTKNIFILLLSTFLLSCQKEIIETEALPAAKEFIEYTILQGEHFSDKNPIVSSSYAEQKFQVRFDNSAIYQTIDPNNQIDVNKLYGFADNNEHHQQYSARFGWYWYQDSLHLLAYVYNKGIQTNQKIGTVLLNKINDCSIKVFPATYTFTLNGKTLDMPRESTTIKAEGYKLYPFFGGDEKAPHTIKIFIKEL